MFHVSLSANNDYNLTKMETSYNYGFIIMQTFLFLISLQVISKHLDFLWKKSNYWHIRTKLGILLDSLLASQTLEWHYTTWPFHLFVLFICIALFLSDIYPADQQSQKNWTQCTRNPNNCYYTILHCVASPGILSYYLFAQDQALWSWGISYGCFHGD